MPPTVAAEPLMMGTKINLKTVQIEGGTIYPLNELAEIYKPLIGHESSLADLIEATRNITRRYQNDGYLLSYAFLPQQSFEDGAARVVLVEGYVRDVQVQGDIGRVKGLIDRLTAKIQAERGEALVSRQGEDEVTEEAAAETPAADAETAA